MRFRRSGARPKPDRHGRSSADCGHGSAAGRPLTQRGGAAARLCRIALAAWPSPTVGQGQRLVDPDVRLA
jgi:hypothetical protein